jgi:GntR family transcriptional regulator/MocR family aminotransferase
LIHAQDLFGRIELRRAIAGYLCRSKGLNCSEEQVIIFSQTQNALNVLCRLLLNTGDRIAIEEPGFGGIKNVVFPQDIQLCPVQVDDEGMKITDGIETIAPVQLIYVTAAHQDPTGITMSLRRREELLDNAHRQRAWIVEDDFDSDYYYGKNAELPLSTLDPIGLVIHMGSFWKTLYPLTNLGYLVVPPSLLPLMRAAKSITEPNAASIEHLALADLISEGYLERHIRRTTKIYGRRRSQLLLNLKKVFGQSVEITKQSAGTHQLVRFDGPWDETLIAEQAASAGLGLESSRKYYLQEHKEKEFLLEFASVDVESCASIVGTFYKALSSN